MTKQAVLQQFAKYVTCDPGQQFKRITEIYMYQHKKTSKTCDKKQVAE